MQRRNHRRVSAAMQYAVRTYLETTAMGKGVPGYCAGARPAQIKAGAKLLVKSGKLPSNMRLQRAR
jgi:hypothetical protein